jgi:hypothetical protein
MIGNLDRAVVRVGFNGCESVGHPAIAPLRGDAASLTDTMKFIQEKPPCTVNYMVYLHDNVAGTQMWGGPSGPRPGFTRQLG